MIELLQHLYGDGIVFFNVASASPHVPARVTGSLAEHCAKCHAANEQCAMPWRAEASF